MMVVNDDNNLHKARTVVKVTILSRCEKQHAQTVDAQDLILRHVEIPTSGGESLEDVSRMGGGRLLCYVQKEGMHMFCSLSLGDQLSGGGGGELVRVLVFVLMFVGGAGVVFIRERGGVVEDAGHRGIQALYHARQ